MVDNSWRNPRFMITDLCKLIKGTDYVSTAHKRIELWLYDTTATTKRRSVIEINAAVILWTVTIYVHARLWWSQESCKSCSSLSVVILVILSVRDNVYDIEMYLTAPMSIKVQCYTYMQDISNFLCAKQSIKY